MLIRRSITYCQKRWGVHLALRLHLCIPCHKQIHALYTNEEIAARLTSIPKLKEDPQLSRFLKWIRKQPSTKLMKIKKSNDRKRRR